MSGIIKVSEGAKIVRRQILVVECGAFLKADQRKHLRDEIVKQMQSGLVLLPECCKAITCDEDATIVVRDWGNRDERKSVQMDGEV